jgi:glycosyltransferase involved in cell wall biosynthesis
MGKGSLYKDINSVIKDIPKIVINHGTPYYPENFQSDIIPANYKAFGYTKDQIGFSSELIEANKKAVGDNYLVVNSHKAALQWGMGKAIIHGLDPDEWQNKPKEPRCITVLSPAGLDKYYDRKLYQAVKEELEERHINICQITVDVRFGNFKDYQEFLSRSLIYFHPMLEAPMSRGRTEAMMSGACVVTTPSQDADTFIEHGKNGFIVPRNPKTIADLIEGLIYDYKTAYEVGQRGRETALELFHADRYRQEWREYLEYVINDFKNK